MIPLHIDPSRQRYRALVGTGGIGSGMFFALDGNHTLGREESRSGRLLDRRDYCKLHIIAHTVAVLLGPAARILPIGRVGRDIAGQRLMEEMAEAGMDLRYVKVLDGEQTLLSICFVYPDNSGGNMTVNDSACARVTPAVIREADPECATLGRDGMVLAAPEVPMEARIELLRLGTRHGCFRAASFASGEMERVRSQGLLADVDYLAINVHEAALLSGKPAERPPADTVADTVSWLRIQHPRLQVSITAGRDGSWTWDGTALRHLPPVPVSVVSTAGAGDAFMGGVLAGLAAGLSLGEAHALGNLAGSFSVTSPHTIHPGLDGAALLGLVRETGAGIDPAVRALLEGTR